MNMLKQRYPNVPKYSNSIVGGGSWELDELVDNAFETGRVGVLERPMIIEVRPSGNVVRVSLLTKRGGREIAGYNVVYVEDNELADKSNRPSGRDVIIQK